MKRIDIYRAIGDEVESVVIKIDLEVPKWDQGTTESQYRDFFAKQAAQVVDGLMALPGGTLDRVLSLLLDRKASLWRIQWPQDRK